MLKLDAYNHIWPKPFYDRLIGHIGTMTDITMRSGKVPMMTDLDRRFQVMDLFGEDYRQILSLASPPLEMLAGPAKALELGQCGNDAQAELVAKYPDRFPAFIASIPMADPDAGVAEAERAVTQLGAKAVQIFTNVQGRPLDGPEFEGLWKWLSDHGVAAFMHPTRGAKFTDYLTEDESEYEIWWTFGWPYETSAAMARLTFSGVFDRHPGLRIVTHHAGGMVPFFEGRVGAGWDQMGARTSGRDLQEVLRGLKRPHLEYFREFWADTASFGSKKAIEHALEFFGPERVIFASDAPFDPEGGPMYIRETIAVIDALDIPDATRAAIYQDNTARLLGLTL